MSTRRRDAPTPGGSFIDLPPPPLHVARPEAVLAGAPVVVHTMDGRRVAGALTRLGGARHRIALRTPRARDPVEIPLETVRYVAFPTPLDTPDPPHPALSGAQRMSPPPRTRPYLIVFRDGRERRGRALGSLRDHSGVHLFVPRGDGCSVRVFVPADQIRSYALGARLGDVLVKRHAASAQQVSAALESQRRLRAEAEAEAEAAPAPAPAFDSTQGLVAALEADHGGQTLSQKSVPRVGALLESAGGVSDEQIHHALAEKLGLPFVHLAGFDFDQRAVRAVSADFAREHQLVPLLYHGERLVVAMEDPTDGDSLSLTRFVSGNNVDAVVASREDVHQAIERCYGALDERAALAAVNEAAPGGAAHDELEIARALAERAPVVQLVDQLLHDAVRRRASDIHVRPGERTVDVLLRIDGNLVLVSTLNKLLLPAVVARIKILGRMNITEKRLPQDGRARVVDGDRAVDLRLSVIPTVGGESVVIRLLDSELGLRAIDDLGLTADDLAAVRGSLHRMHGLILVAGPTGSGKSTTLYSALGEVRSRNLNIITVEDPVEFHIDGIEQVQVNAGIGLTFARVLRNILRHDPDVIMVGEIRDRETAAISVESALTGHLVLSTLHTNTAAGAVSRLLEMGIEPFLLSPTLLCVISQRLLRRNCPQCRIDESPEEAIVRALGLTGELRFRRGTGCAACGGTGTAGRVGVYEVLKVDPALREAIGRSAEEAELDRIGKAAGMEPMIDCAMRLAHEGEIAIGEVYRIFHD
jgi:type IV pilus assembly protein PilB